MPEITAREWTFDEAIQQVGFGRFQRKLMVICGVGWASGMTRIAGAIAPTLGGYLLPISLVAALSLYAVAFAVGGLAVLALGTETRGRPLLDTV
jgi:hypothetical protein